MSYDDHLDEQDWQRLLRGHEQPREIARSLLHVALCDLCRERAPATCEELLRRAFGEALPFDELPGPAGRRRAERLFTRAMARVESQIDRAAEEIAAAPGLWAELQEHPWQRKQWMVRNAARFQHCGFALYVLERSRDCWHNDAAEAHRRADLAWAVLRRLPAAEYPGGFLADCEARAQAYLGHTARLLGNLLEAETAFAAARRGLERGGGSLDEAACVAWLEAELRREQGRFDEALELSHQAAWLYRRIGDRERCVEASLLWAEIVEEAGRAREVRSVGVSGLPRSEGAGIGEGRGA